MEDYVHKPNTLQLYKIYKVNSTENALKLLIIRLYLQGTVFKIHRNGFMERKNAVKKFTVWFL